MKEEEIKQENNKTERRKREYKIWWLELFLKKRRSRIIRKLKLV